MRRVAMAVLAMMMTSAPPASACDPFSGRCGQDRYDPQEQPPVVDQVVWTAPGSDVLEARVATAPDPEVERIALGLHRVSEAWTGHAVATHGLMTTFTTSSVAMDTGTSARLVASVGTGESSDYDGRLSGGRMSLSDGRPVKGDVYANYAWSGHDWALDRYVFFQDDLEIARLSRVAPEPIPVSVPPPARHFPVPAPRPATPLRAVTSAPASAAPVTRIVPPRRRTASPRRRTSRPAPRAVQPAPRAVHAGIALAPQADPLGRAEVLRGRSVPLWVRATVDGIPGRVVSWELSSGELTALGPVAGSGDEPLVATWRSITEPGMTFTVRLRARVDVPGEGPREVDAVIDVIVRSPALVD